MNEPSVCSQCRSTVPQDAPNGLCPRCLVLVGLGPQAPEDSANQATVDIDTTANTEFHSLQNLESVFPNLEFIELLGRGGMGVVYKAKQKELGRIVAVKILSPEVRGKPAFTDRFEREAKAMAKLNHPNIVTIHEFGKRDSHYYLLMEFVDGPNLRQFMQRERLSPTEALKIVPQICDALQYAHNTGVIHRDIKPENMLIDSRGNIKIADFGLSKLMRQEEIDLSLTGDHQVMGTPLYMAPEQMHQTKSVDHRADLYSLGVVFYELLTGEMPVGRFDPPSQKSGIDSRLDEIILKTLEGQPERRYQNASEIKTDIELISASTANASTANANKEHNDQAVTKATDALFSRRLTWILAAMWMIWATLIILGQAAYLMKFEWYFDKQDFLYKMLAWGMGITTTWLAFFFLQWWYVLAKPKNEPRSLQGFFTLCQTPDPRHLRMWGFIIPGVIGASAIGLSASYWGNDIVQTVTMSLIFLAAPILAAMACVWTYGFPSPSDHDSHSSSD